MLETYFSETAEAQPELLGHHYTEVGLYEQAIPYWQQAGEQAKERSAYAEAVAHLTQGLSLLARLPETPERLDQELDLQVALGPALMTFKGHAHDDVERTYARARDLCGQMGEPLKHASVLWGLRRFYTARGEYQRARDLADDIRQLAHQQDDPVLLQVAHSALMHTLLFLGEYVPIRDYLDIELRQVPFDSVQEQALAVHYGFSPAVQCLSLGAQALWCLGSPDQAIQTMRDACELAQTLEHYQSQAMALHWAAFLCWRRREAQATYEYANTLLALATEQGFTNWITLSQLMRGWALDAQGQSKEGMGQLCESMAVFSATGHRVSRSLVLALMAEVHGKMGQVEEALPMLNEALAVMEESGRGDHQSEVYRLKGQLLHQQSPMNVPEAEACFQQSLDMAHRQEAKAWELRAATSLARLWQSQEKSQEAYDLLSPVYEWCTEGFDTADLKDAKALLGELSADICTC